MMMITQYFGAFLAQGPSPLNLSACAATSSHEPLFHVQADCCGCDACNAGHVSYPSLESAH